MMQHPSRKDDVGRAREFTEIENVGLSVLNIRYTQLLRLSFGITDAAEAQVYRQNTNTAESLSREDRVTTRAAAGDKRLRCAVITHWRKRSKRKSALQFTIEVQGMVFFLQLHPARIGIPLILTAYFFGSPGGDRRQTFDASAQRLLFERFANLLAQNCVYWTREI